MQQRIFDIQTFSLHDGPGIRTTVFLKGCPLRCLWCCNPEGFEAGPTLSYQDSKCLGCLACVEVCPTDALTADEAKLEVQHHLCNGCGACLEVCPSGALKLFGYERTAREIIDRIKRDKKYFDKSGGGLTLSGGEVMKQSVYALEILKLAKQENIHTCIETSGYAQQEEFKQLLPYVDIFLFDYKISDPEDHLKFTGVSNELILDNLKFLSVSGCQIILRVPLIPGINDTDQHFRTISDISKRYSGIQGVEVLPYHNWGEHKFKDVGLKKPDIQAKSVSASLAGEWLEKLRAMDCKNVTLA